MKERNFIFQDEVPYLMGGAWELLKGQYLRVLARHTVDFVAYNLRDLNERIDQPRTKTNQMKVFVTKGDVLYSNEDNVLLTIVEDTWRWRHDMQKGTCSRKRHETKFQGLSKNNTWGVEGSPSPWERWEDIPPRGCWENIAIAVERWGISPWDIPSPLNIFQNMRFDSESGQLWSDHQVLDDDEEDAFVEFKAEMDLLVAGANDLDGTAPFHIQIYDA
ncbi:MAG: hypothetical protein BZY82_10155 [SAR202 cluster bacterium Io17-Chloro-G3]|nr:MAG: hypothetical protein BZY82_10155 [SAR202 cluster bacterium Io17-Chloro-G3]